MFGMGWSEMLVVGIVALIVVGPKDLPGMFRTIGEFTGKAKGMAREFNRAMNAAADDAGVKDITKTINAAANPKSFGVDKLKEATGIKDAVTSGGVTEQLAEARAASKAKFMQASADVAAKRQAADTVAETPAATPKPTAKPEPSE